MGVGAWQVWKHGMLKYGGIVPILLVSNPKPLPYCKHSVYNCRWLGSTAGRTGSLGIPAYLQSVLEPTFLFKARHGVSAL